MRQSLVDWMSQQHSSLDLVDETLHLAVRYLDTFLVRRGASRPAARSARCRRFKISFQTQNGDVSSSVCALGGDDDRLAATDRP